MFSGSRKTPHELSADIERYLTEPFMPEFSDYVQKIRRNSIAVSCVALTVVYGGVRIESDFSANGLKVTGLDHNLVMWILLLLTVYWFVHFTWCATDYFGEWRIRLTGQKKNPYIMDIEDDLVGADRNGVLTRWAYFAQQPMISFYKLLHKVDSTLRDGNLSIEEKAKALDSIAAAKDRIEQALNASSHNERSLDHRLERFERWMLFFRSSESFRWLIIELSGPILLGAWATFKLTGIVFCPVLVAVLNKYFQ